jgi:L-lactate dehydrogenase
MGNYTFKKKSKVAIIGTGFVGASAAYAISMRHIVSEIVLIDVDAKRANSERLDISHGIPHMGYIKITAGTYENCADCDVIVITAGLGRKPGESRLDLGIKNMPIAKSIIGNIMKYYNGGVILVVSNPLDVITYFIQKWSGLPNGRVVGTGTLLDTSRFVSALSSRFGVNAASIHATILGEHGDSMVPIWSKVQIDECPINEYCELSGLPFTEDDKIAIGEKVKTAGARVINGKGATYFAIATCVCDAVDSIVKNKNTILPLSTILNGEYGISDVALSVPCVLNANGVERKICYSISDEEQALLNDSAKQIKDFIAQMPK